MSLLAENVGSVIRGENSVPKSLKTAGKRGRRDKPRMGGCPGEDGAGERVLIPASAGAPVAGPPWSVREVASAVVPDLKQSWGQKERSGARQGLIMFFCSSRASERFPTKS